MDFFNSLSFYCINLDKRTDRWVKVQQQFDKIGICEKVTRVSAVTDSSIQSDSLSAAEQSLIETNRRILDRAKLSAPVCIFEDDVYFLQDLDITELMARVSEQLPEYFGLLYLGAHLFDPVITHPRVSPNLIRLQPESRPTKEKDHVYVGGAHAVVYSVKAIEYIRSLPIETLYEKQWDVFLSKYLIPEFPCFMVYPAFAFQIEDVSDIEGKMTERNWIIEYNRKGIRQGKYSGNILERLRAKAGAFFSGES
jgi:hypothetical protein